MPSRRSSYRDKVDPESVTPIVKTVMEQMAIDDEIWLAAALHEHIREEVDYDTTVGPNFNRPPLETYKNGGNCVDLSILMCSLFSAVGFRCRLIAIDGDDDDAGHMTATIAFPGDPRGVTDTLTGYYTEQGRFRERTYTWFEDEYFVADHSARYIGDITPLEEYQDPRGRMTIQETVDI